MIAIVEEVLATIDLPAIIRESTGSMASETVRGARMTGISVDDAISRGLERHLFRRRRPPAPARPGERRERARSCPSSRWRRGPTRESPRASPPGSPRTRSTPWWSGRDAQRVRRFRRDPVLRQPAHLRGARLLPVLSVLGFLAVSVVYLTGAWWINGQTFGDRVMGVRVVTGRGARLRLVRAFARAVFCAFFPIGPDVVRDQPETPVRAGPGAADARRLRLAAPRDECLTPHAPGRRATRPGSGRPSPSRGGAPSARRTRHR